MSFWSSIKRFGRNIDPTYSKGTVGKITSPIAKPVVQSTQVLATGGASLLWMSKAQKKDAVHGFVNAGKTGLGFLTGGPVGAVVAGAAVTAQDYANSVRKPTGTVTNGEVTTGDPSNPSIVKQASILGNVSPLTVGLAVAAGLAAMVLFGKRG